MKTASSILLLLLGLVTSSVRAQIAVGNPEIDQFNYTASNNLVGQTSAQGLVWISAGTGTGTNQPVITNVNLTVPGLANGSGNAVNFGTPAGTDAILPVTPHQLGTNVESVYYSMAFRVNALGTLTSSPIFVACFEEGVNAGASAQPTIVGARLYLAKVSGTTYNIGINKADGTTTTHIAWEGGATNGASFNVGTTYFIVAAYNFSGTENGTDSASLWVNPATNTFGAANAPTGDPSYTNTAALPNAGGADIQNDSANDQIWGFMLRQGNATEPASMTVDQLYIGLSWADVTPLPPLATPTFSGLTNPPAITYGSSIGLSGKVSATGPLYPAMGESVFVTINSNQQSTTITDAVGDFSISYKTTAPTNLTPYTITYTYLGDATLSAATDTTTTVTVSTALPVVLSGSRMTDGTSTAAAAMLYVSNAVSGDVLTFSGGPATLAGSTAGTQAITSFGTLSLVGSAATNYTMTGASGAVKIATPPFTVGHPDFEPFANATGSNGTAYNPGDNLVGETNAQGLSWVAAGSAPEQPALASGILSYPGLVADSGNEVNYGANQGGESAQLDLGTSVGGSPFFGGSSFTVYYSMLFEVTSLGALTNTPAIVAGFNNTAGAQATTPTTIGARLYTRLSGSGYNIGINKADGASNDIAWETNVYAVSSTNFIVAAYTFSGNAAATNDTVALWVNPAANTFGASMAPTNDPSYTNTSGGPNIGGNSSTDKIAGFLLREASSLEPGGMTVDELSIGLSWADVTPTGAVTVTRFPILSESISGTNFILTWQSVAGANYQVVGSSNVLIAVSNWANVGSPITATGTNTSATNPITQSVNFYAVKSP